MAIKDDITAVLHDDIIPLLEDEIWADTFALQGDIEVSDGKGGLRVTPGTIAMGMCRLREATGSSERALADRLSWATAYAIDLPVGLTVTPENTIIVDGRTFQIGSVVDTGLWAVKKTLIAQEQG